MQDQKIKARVIEPVLLERAGKLPQGSGWGYELKLDGFRAVHSRRAAESISGRATTRI